MLWPLRTALFYIASRRSPKCWRATTTLLRGSINIRVQRNNIFTLYIPKHHQPGEGKEQIHYILFLFYIIYIYLLLEI